MSICTLYIYVNINVLNYGATCLQALVKFCGIELKREGQKTDTEEPQVEKEKQMDEGLEKEDEDKEKEQDKEKEETQEPLGMHQAVWRSNVNIRM